MKTGVEHSSDPSDPFQEFWLRIDIPETTHPGFPVKEIEEDIVLELVKRHQEWVNNSL
jgi:phosphopantothenate-cysteine ligase